MDGYLLNLFPIKVRSERPFTRDIATPWQGKVRIINKAQTYKVKAEKIVTDIPIMTNAYKEVMQLHLIAAQNEHVNDGDYYSII